MATDLTDLTNVALLAGRAEDVDYTLGAALEALAEVIEYDLAAVLILDGEFLRMRCARGRLNSSRVASHSINLSHAPELRSALLGGLPRIFEEADHNQSHGGEGDPYQGIVDLPHGHACLVAPLIAGGRTLGLMTFDRSICQRYDETTVALVTVYAQLVAMAMGMALRNAELEAAVSRRTNITVPNPPTEPQAVPVQPLLVQPLLVQPLLTLEMAERQAILAALTAAEGKMYGDNGAAAVLGCPPSTLQHRMRKLGLTKSSRLATKD